MSAGRFPGQTRSGQRTGCSRWTQRGFNVARGTARRPARDVLTLTGYKEWGPRPGQMALILMRLASDLVSWAAARTGLLWLTGRKSVRSACTTWPVLAALIVAGCGVGAAPSSVDPTSTALALEVESLRATATAVAQPTPSSVPTVTPLTATPIPTAVPSPTSLTLQDAINNVKQVTVLVVTNQAQGSGISLGQGDVLTNHHVVQGSTDVEVRFADGHQTKADVIRLDPTRDLALLHTTFVSEPAATFRDSQSLESGEELVAVGYPSATVIGAQNMTVTRGIFSSRWQSPWGVWHVQTDAAANHGNSGGPLADSQGRVVGVVTFGITGTVGLNYAVASDEVAAFRQGGGVPAAASTDCDDAQLSIVSHTVAASRIAPGSSLTLQFTVENASDAAAPVVLGASIRPASGGSWISDSANDLEVTVRPSQSRFSRQFQVPASLAPGSYDVAWGLFCSGTHTSHGLVVDSSAVTITSAASDSAQTASDPASTVRQFYAYIDAGDLDQAWNLLSPRFKGQTSKQAWQRGYQTTRASKVLSAQVTSQSPSTATVAFALASTDVTSSGTVNKQFAGTWTLVRSGGNWLLDQANVRQTN